MEGRQKSKKNSIPQQVNRKMIFFSHFSDGYVFRKVFEFYKSTFSEVPLTITKDGISISNIRDETKNIKVLVNGYFHGYFLLQHETHSSLFSDPENKVHQFNLSSKEVSEVAKNITTKDECKIWQYEGDNFINLCVKKSDSTSPPTFEICIREYITPPETEKHPVLERSKANFNITLNEFVSACSSLTKSKATSATTKFKVFKHGMRIESTNIYNGKNEFGKIKDSELDKYWLFTIQPEVIKSFVKMKAFNNKSIAKFFCIDDEVLRIEIPISSCGTKSIIIINKNDDSEDRDD